MGSWGELLGWQKPRGQAKLARLDLQRKSHEGNDGFPEVFHSPLPRIPEAAGVGSECVKPSYPVLEGHTTALVRTRP